MPDEEMPDVWRLGVSVVIEKSEDSSNSQLIQFTRRQAEYVADEHARILAEDWS